MTGPYFTRDSQRADVRSSSVRESQEGGSSPSHGHACTQPWSRRRWCIRGERGDALLDAWGKLRAVLATLDAEALGDSIVMNEAAVARFSSRDSPLRDTMVRIRDKACANGKIKRLTPNMIKSGLTPKMTLKMRAAAQTGLTVNPRTATRLSIMSAILPGMEAYEEHMTTSSPISPDPVRYRPRRLWR